MSNYNNDGRGALFKNENKDPDSNQPDYSGHITPLPCPVCNTQGSKNRLAAWIETSKDGTKTYMGLQESVFQEKKSPAPEQKQDAYNKSNFVADDEMPF